MPQESERAEWMNQNINRCIHILLIQVGAQTPFSVKCFYDSCNAHTSVACSPCMKEPEDLLASVKSGVGHLRIFDCNV